MLQTVEILILETSGLFSFEQQKLISYFLEFLRRKDLSERKKPILTNL